MIFEIDIPIELVARIDKTRESILLWKLMHADYEIDFDGLPRPLRSRIWEVIERELPLEIKAFEESWRGHV